MRTSILGCNVTLEIIDSTKGPVYKLSGTSLTMATLGNKLFEGSINAIPSLFDESVTINESYLLALDTPPAHALLEQLRAASKKKELG